MNTRKRKIIFFDIDGTLVNFKMQMPSSARIALKALKNKGYKIALCTGRPISNIYPWLMEFGFDVIIASAGAHVVADGQTIFHVAFDAAAAENAFRIICEHQGICMYQGAEGRYMTKDHFRKLRRYMLEQGMSEDVIIKGMNICDYPWEQPSLESSMYFGADVKVDQMKKELPGYFQVTGSSYGNDRDYVGELNIKGITKATGIEKVLEYYHMNRADSIAFGDGPNDFDMIDYVETGVVMGNGIPQLKKHADMIALDIDHHGIREALLQLGLIDRGDLLMAE